MLIKKVLVVDDSPTDRFYFTDLLRKGGFQVVTADSGEQALAKAESERPDLILMDIIMPGMNGFQATRTINRNAATKHIPIIICTTKGQATDKIWGLRQGAVDYLPKPVSEETLLTKIRSLG
jgi:twitching motility two-component system response regulator PilH